jgi:hypothetical protein
MTPARTAERPAAKAQTLAEQSPADHVASLKTARAARSEELLLETAGLDETRSQLTSDVAKGKPADERLRRKVYDHETRVRELGDAIRQLDQQLAKAEQEAKAAAIVDADRTASQTLVGYLAGISDVEQEMYTFAEGFARTVARMKGARERATAAHHTANRVAGRSNYEHPFDPAVRLPLTEAWCPASEAIVDGRELFWRAVNAVTHLGTPALTE